MRTHLSADRFPTSSEDVCALEELLKLRRTVRVEDYAHACSVNQGVLIYDAIKIEEALDDGDKMSVQKSLYKCLSTGPGVFVVKNLQGRSVIDQMTQVFKSIIDKEKDVNEGADHFGNGTNDRLWNAAEKTCLKDPDTFVDYYKNRVLAMVCEAWLGPNFQLTSQVNAVKPGGVAQAMHRDYHLGFQEDEVIQQYPLHVHKMSSMLTLQGAIAHGCISVEAGATKLLPFSQQYDYGYLAFRKPEVQALFEEHHIAIPLQSGDGLFFNPALLHAGGHNQTQDVYRVANLLQISSCMGKPMEVVDNEAMIHAAYPVLRSRLCATEMTMSPPELDAICTILCDCYPFPTNLDRDPPVGGCSPITMKEHLLRALQRGGDGPDFLEEYLSRRLTSTAFQHKLQVSRA